MAHDTPIHYNALSIDVEEYFQVSAFEASIARDAWERWPSRVEFATGRLLDLFAERGVHATFFTLGWVAERHPALIRRMVAEGHEVACHGYQHIRATTQSRAAFRADITLSKRLLEEAGGVEVRGYRAASFSIDRSNLWAFDELAAAGFAYSSSVYPVRHDLYGIPDAPRTPFRPLAGAPLVEIPVSTARFGTHNLPAGGGGYFRLLPYVLSRALVRRVNRAEARAANMYFHPWEFDPEQPRPTGVPAKSRFRHYLNQGRALARMRRLLEDFRWGPFRDVYARAIAGLEPEIQHRDLSASS
ncbi:MAG: XrtA system polysaccharide deacetylase [Gammaproteobacteria bacterium]